MIFFYADGRGRWWWQVGEERKGPFSSYADCLAKYVSTR